MRQHAYHIFKSSFCTAHSCSVTIECNKKFHLLNGRKVLSGFCLDIKIDLPAGQPTIKVSVFVNPFQSLSILMNLDLMYLKFLIDSLGQPSVMACKHYKQISTVELLVY